MTTAKPGVRCVRYCYLVSNPAAEAFGLTGNEPP